jgi:hypothetical protein
MAIENDSAPVGREDVVGVFLDRELAERAVTALAEAGFDQAQVGFLTPGEDTEPAYFRRTGKSIAAGSVAGAVLGALAAVAIPGLGLAVAGGTMLAAAMGAATGGATGGVAGLLFGSASSRDHALYYSQELRRGRTLVTVACASEDRQRVRELLLGMGALEAAPMAPEG